MKADRGGISAILEKLNNPHTKISCIHIAGTNGKGSACMFLQNILTKSGYKTGVFTSPHLKKFNERIAINGVSISDEDFAAQVEIVTKAVHQANVPSISFFDLLTLMAFNFFAETNVDIAIIETGIGGRNDVTNIIPKPLLSVITSIGYDHMEILGYTLQQIAREKAGIIKPNCPVTLYPTEPEILNVFSDEAKINNSKLFYTGKSLEFYEVCQSIEETVFSVKTEYFSYQSLRLKLLGENQIMNAAHALLNVHALRSGGMQIPEKAVRDGLYETRWPGRFEITAKPPESAYILLDGSHNINGAQVFRRGVEHYFPDCFKTFVVGMTRHKDYESVMRHILPIADAVICTRPYSYQALPVESLFGFVNCFLQESTRVPVWAIEDCKEALDYALKVSPRKPEETLIAVTGSLYLVGDII